MHPEFAPVAFISAASLFLVLPWHWRAGNVAAISMAIWLFITNIIYGVDAIIWGDNVKIVIPIWCDITTKIIIGSQLALPAACLCISIHLERVASVRAARIMQQDKRRRQIFETCMCLGLPLVFMALHYIVQGHRFDIIEEYGCRPTTYISYVGIFLMYVPTLLLAFISFVFSALALRHFLKRRITFALHLQAAQSALTTSRYFRLMSMALIQMITVVAVTGYTLWFTLIAVPLRPYTSWDSVHSDWLRIDQYFTFLTPPLVIRSYYALWWMVPFSTLVFIAFFAFGKEAIDEYKKCFSWIRRTIFRQNPSEKISPKGSLFGRIPVKFTLPISLSSPKQTLPTTAVSNVSLPEYKYPQPPTPPKYLSQHGDDDPDFSETSSYYHSSNTPITNVDLEAHPLPPTPLSYASESSSDNLKQSAESPSPSAHFPSYYIDRSPDVSAEPPASGLYGHDSTTSPLPPPPRSRPRVRPVPSTGSEEPSSPRPLTYPSADAWHRSITITFPSKS